MLVSTRYIIFRKNNGEFKIFKPNYQNVVDCAYNREPKHVPLYEHNISANIIEKITGWKFVHLLKEPNADLNEYMKYYCRFFEQMGTVRLLLKGA